MRHRRLRSSAAPPRPFTACTEMGWAQTPVRRGIGRRLVKVRIHLGQSPNPHTQPPSEHLHGAAPPQPPPAWDPPGACPFPGFHDHTLAGESRISIRAYGIAPRSTSWRDWRHASTRSSTRDRRGRSSSEVCNAPHAPAHALRTPTRPKGLPLGRHTPPKHTHELEPRRSRRKRPSPPHERASVAIPRGGARVELTPLPSRWPACCVYHVLTLATPRVRR